MLGATLSGADSGFREMGSQIPAGCLMTSNVLRMEVVLCPGAGPMMCAECMLFGRGGFPENHECWLITGPVSRMEVAW